MLAIATVWIHGGLLHDVRLHQTQELAEEWAKAALGDGAFDDPEDAFDCKNEIHITEVNYGTDELRLNTWYR